MILPESFTETLGIIIMKNKDLVFYTISAAVLCLFVLVSLVVENSNDENFPGNAFLQEWMESGDQFALGKN